MGHGGACNNELHIMIFVYLCIPLVREAPNFHEILKGVLDLNMLGTTDRRLKAALPRPSGAYPGGGEGGLAPPLHPNLHRQA